MILAWDVLIASMLVCVLSRSERVQFACLIAAIVAGIYMVLAAGNVA